MNSVWNYWSLNFRRIKKELQKTQSQLSTYKGKVAELQKSIKENEKRHVTTGYPTATSPVAENIANENNELSKKSGPGAGESHSAGGGY
ncbi:hypothetical protein LNO36_21105 [Klebsiella variicola subsp. variicola]|nr:hypothetical protein [Klebsiella variicola subsp. variicola]